MNEISLKELYAGLQEKMIIKLRCGEKAFNHPVEIGDTTEADWIKWLRDYLPQRYKVDGGIIIDCNGKQSDQIDIVIYDQQYSYLIFHQGDKLLIPAESVYAVFEVKPVLNKANMKYAGEKAKSVRELYRTSVGIKHAGGKYPPKLPHNIIAGILTNDMSWKRQIIQHVVENLQTDDSHKRLDLVCSLSSNTFVADYDVDPTVEQEQKAKLRFCHKEESLVFLLLSLLKKLQDIGTVPAIDFMKYAEALSISTQNI